MIYNLTPFTTLLTDQTPNAGVWKERIEYFFNNEEYDPELQDLYYDRLLREIEDVKFFFDTSVSIFKEKVVISSLVGMSLPIYVKKGEGNYTLALNINSV